MVDQESFGNSFPESIPCTNDPENHVMQRKGNFYVCPICTVVEEDFDFDEQFVMVTPPKRTRFNERKDPLKLGTKCFENPNHLRRLIVDGAYSCYICPQCHPLETKVPHEPAYLREDGPTITYIGPASEEELKKLPLSFRLRGYSRPRRRRS